ncbi:serine/threonine-protein kinase [Streptosporangium sp. 'caverna']|uniref:serine/threonine-protein kinase n=1 Tax=Streptosporangium sp. 'caverna' TaxID=2202249 RepID=UPI0013A6C355|nr:serine/threonine-protein kinase [Streptosporangium sp. 'caverna']
MELLAGRYRLMTPLGEGGFGMVWQATDELLRREVAIKQVRIPPGLGEQGLAEFTARSIREARAAGRLSHPAIVRIHDVVTHDERPWIVMDLVPGHSLDKLVPLPTRRVAQIGLAILDALSVAHAHGILHRDVKPANVLLDADGRAMLTDFGIAVSFGAESPDERSLVGSPGYIAPERFRQESVGPSSDLWSLGATLYTAVEGEGPFSRKHPEAIIAAVILHEPQPMVRASPELARLVLALLDKDPDRRPTTAATREVLTRLAAGLQTTDRPARRLAPRKPILIGALIVALVVAGGLGAWYLAFQRPGGSEESRFSVAPDPCLSLTTTQVQRLLRTDADGRPVDGGGCRWVELRSGHNLSINVTYQVSPTGRDDFATQRTVREKQAGTIPATTTQVRDQPGLADEGYARDTVEAGTGTVSSTIWFRRSNLIAEVTARQTGDASALPELGETAVQAAAFVDVALG